MKFNYWFFGVVGACDTYLKVEKRKLLMNILPDFVIYCCRLFIMYVSVECKLRFNNLSFRHSFLDIHHWHDFTRWFVALFMMLSAHRWAYFDNFSNSAHKKHNRTPPPRKHSRKGGQMSSIFPSTASLANDSREYRRHDFWSSALKWRQNRSRETFPKITFFSDKFQPISLGKQTQSQRFSCTAKGSREFHLSCLCLTTSWCLIISNLSFFHSLRFTCTRLFIPFSSLFLYASSRTQHQLYVEFFISVQ